MTRFWLVLVIIGGLLLMPFKHPAMAQVRGGTDTIRFVGAKQGVNWDGLGEAWCWVVHNANNTGWHGYWVSDVYSYTDTSSIFHPDDGNALDEVAQIWSYDQTAAFNTYCPSVDSNNQPLAPQVMFRAFGQTDAAGCPPSSPCQSVWVNGTTGVYNGTNCSYIEADLFDYGTYAVYPGFPDPYNASEGRNGDWKGKVRMLHALSPTLSWNTIIYVTYGSWIQNSVQVGTVQLDSGCSTNYHVHQDFLPPITGQQCLLTKNTTLAPTGAPTGNISPSPNQIQTGKRTTPDYWVHSLTHPFGAPCVNLGPAIANILLGSGPGNVLDSTGAGAYNLANGPSGSSVTTPVVVNIPGTSWKGQIAVTDEVLRIAVCVLRTGMRPIDCARAKLMPIPNSGNGSHISWYGPDSQGYYLKVYWQMDNYLPREGQCFAMPAVQPLNWVEIQSSAGGTCNTGAGWYGTPNPAWTAPYKFPVDTDGGLQTVWSQFRGQGGINPSQGVPTLADAKAAICPTSTTCVQWLDLKPLMNTTLSGLPTWRDLAAAGIGPADGSARFECRFPSNSVPVNPSPDYSEPCRKYFINTVNP